MNLSSTISLENMVQLLVDGCMASSSGGCRKLWVLDWRGRCQYSTLDVWEDSGGRRRNEHLGTTLDCFVVFCVDCFMPGSRGVEIGCVDLGFIGVTSLVHAKQAARRNIPEVKHYFLTPVV